MSGDTQPQFKTEDVDDLVTLLHRAANWAEEVRHGETVAEEIRTGERFAEKIANEWACEECRERLSTCSKGGADLCNDCAGLVLEASD